MTSYRVELKSGTLVDRTWAVLSELVEPWGLDGTLFAVCVHTTKTEAWLAALEKDANVVSLNGLERPWLGRGLERSL